MTAEVEAEIRFDGPAGSGVLRASGRRLVLVPEGWAGVARMVWWVRRRRRTVSAVRRAVGALGLGLEVKLPWFPPLALLKTRPPHPTGTSSST